MTLVSLAWTHLIACATVAILAVGGATGRPPPDPAIAYLKGGKLSVMNADGTNAREIYTPVGVIVLASGISWSPGGGSIAFTEAAGGFSLCRIDVAVVGGVPQGSNRVVLVAGTSTASNWAPAWSPLGDEVAFYDNHSGWLMTVPASGGSPQTLAGPTAPGNVLREPAWSADGAFIAFYEDFANSPLGTINVLERATGTVTTVLGPVSLNVRDTDWARTQNLILFEGDLPGASGIYFLPPIPGASPQFVRAAIGPSWSPDDSALAICEPLKPSKPVNGGNPYVVKRLNLTTGSTTSLGQGLCPEWRR